MEYDTFTKIVDYLSKTDYWLKVLGGEPFVNPDFPKYIDYMSNKFKYTNIVTNGSLVTEKVLRKIKNPPSNISISIDSLGTKHDLNRNFPGAYDLAIKAIYSAKKIIPKTHITIPAVIEPGTIDETRKVFDYAKKNGCGVITIPIRRPIDPTYATSIKSKPYYKNYSKKDLVNYAKFMLEIAQDPVCENTEECLLLSFLYFIGKQSFLQKDKNCYVPLFEMEFNYRGEAFPCVYGLHWRGGISIHDPEFERKYYSLSVKNSKQCRYCTHDVINMDERACFPYHIYFQTKYHRLELLQELYDFIDHNK